MSWLFIDTSERLRIRLALVPERGAIRERVLHGRGSPVASLAAFLNANRIPSLNGIVAVSGPGPFSAVRGGVLVANLLARMYHVPLYGVPVKQAEDLEALRAALVARRIKPSSYVAPVYDREPNITC